MSAQQKFNILTQQCFRRLHNTSDRFDLEVKTRLLSDFMLDLKNSGYDKKDRYRILRGGIKTHKNIKEKEKQGLRPYFRAPDPSKIMRNARKNSKKF